MIIKRVRAENVLRYASLSIDLAERGLIAISGKNESGKSSVGESVCFALFGRTFSIPPDDLEKVIRWGENHCNVTIEFSVEDQAYVLSRFLDRDGNHSAKLALASSPDEPVARGVQRVSEALFGILGFEYEEFVESFYLAQREITTPHPHSQAVKIMAGMAPLEQIAQGLQDEIGEREELLGELQAEWDAVDQDAQALGIRDGRLPQLEDERHQMQAQVERVDSLVAQIDGGVETCAQNADQLNRARGARGRSAFLRFIVLMLALAAGALWGLLTYGTDLPQAIQAREMLAGSLPQWDDSKVNWIGYAAIALGVLFLLLWVRIGGLRRRMASLREESAQLVEVFGSAREIEIEGRPAETTAADAEPMGDYEPEEFPVRPADAEYESLRAMLTQGDVAVGVLREYSERETAWMRAVGERLAAQVSELDDVIGDEQARLQEALNLSDVLNGLTDKRQEVAERIADRHRGLELLAGAVTHLSGQFNRDVKDLVGRMLPLFTDGRYEHLQIDEGLKVRIFSNEKRGFMDLDEVSSGTQRQIMLALRLSLSKKLLRRTVRGKQFAFLDEPFAFFDQERTCKALQALADLGDDISQVWIVAQDFPQNCDVTFDTQIYCERESDTLEISS